jgi:hypothetical protein
VGGNNGISYHVWRGGSVRMMIMIIVMVEVVALEGSGGVMRG